MATRFGTSNLNDMLNQMLAQQMGQSLGREVRHIPETGIMSDLIGGLGPVLGNALQGQGQRMQTTAGYEGLGINPEVASQMGYLPEDQQKQALDRFLQEQSLGQKQANQTQQLEGMLGMAGQAGTSENMTPEELSYIQAVGPKGVMDVRNARLKDRKQQSLDEKDVRAIIAPDVELHKTGREGMHRIKRLKELETEGVMGPGRAKLNESLGALPYIGGIFTGRIDSTSQEFAKIVQEFQRGMKQVYGGRITNSELTEFMKSVPTLMNDKAGRERIYKNMEYMYRGMELPLELKQGIIQKNGGRVPADVDAQVEMKMGKKLDQYAEKFNWGSPKKEDYIRTVGGKQVMLASKLREGQVATNNKTGEKVVVRGGEWVKL